MRILFLDIDGVLNSLAYDRERGAQDGNIDVSRLPLVREIIDRTGARVVLTSSWRVHWDPRGEATDDKGREIADTFAHYGITLFDRTPDPGERAQEVCAWLSAHPDTESFVIIDDMKLGWGALDGHTVKTDHRIGRGLGRSHTDRAIKKLLETE